jgi:hypothetical protein
MILKEWSEALDVYKATLVGSSGASKAIRYNVKSSGHVWTAILVPTLLSTLFVFLALPVLFTKQDTPMWWVGILAFLFLIILLAILYANRAIEKALAKQFKEYYTKHEISQYPFRSRQIYFVYALFLQELKNRKYSHEKVAELSKIAEIAEPPEVLSLRLFQHPLVIFIMGMLTGLCIEVIKRSISNNPKELLFLVLTICELLLVVMAVLSLWYGVINFPKNRHQTIKRYLQWAERDLKEEEFS